VFLGRCIRRGFWECRLRASQKIGIWDLLLSYVSVSFTRYSQMSRNTHNRARKVSQAASAEVANPHPEGPIYFSIPAIHLHYDCKCAKKCRLNRSATAEEIEVQIVYGCNKHLGGQAKELILGDKAVAVHPCPRKGCDCTHATMHLPMEDFNQALIWAGRHPHDHNFE